MAPATQLSHDAYIVLLESPIGRFTGRPMVLAMRTTLSREHLAMNRKSWEAAAASHNRVKGDVAAIVRDGSEYVPPEIAGLFPDCHGKTLVHLLCNDGRELLTMLRQGGHGIGVDFARPAIAFANRVNAELQFDCTFVCAEAVSWLRRQRQCFADVVYTSLGSLWWLPSVRRFFSAVYRVTSPGGYYIVWDFHPVLHMLDNALNVRYDYPCQRIARRHAGGILDYVSDPQSYHLPGRIVVKNKRACANPHVARDFLWSVGDIITSVSAAGWDIDRMIEYPYVYGERILDGLVRRHHTRFDCGRGRPLTPLTFALVLRKRR